jgi:hypothetical protein
MPIGYIFWLLMIVWAVFGFWWGWSRDPRGPWVGVVLVFVLLFLLGWKVFGFVAQ